MAVFLRASEAGARAASLGPPAPSRRGADSLRGCQLLDDADEKCRAERFWHHVAVLAAPLFDLVPGPTVRDTFPLGWHDSIAVRLGYEFFATPKDTFRIGYVFHHNPIPDETVVPLLAGTLEHAVSLGYGHQREKWRADFAYQFSWGPASNSSRSRIVGGDFDHSTVGAKAHWFIVSLSYSF